MFGPNTEPPAAETAYEIKPTLIMSIWCTSYAVSIIFFRCAGRWLRTERIWVEDIILLVSILVMVARMTLVTFVLRFGTNNVDPLSLLGDEDIRRREIGSQLVLGCRVLYATFLWLNKLSVGIYLARLTDQFWAAKSLTSKSSGGRAIKTFLSRHLNDIFYAFLGISFVAVLISEAAECRPFTSYWQVLPKATPSCRIALGHLLTMGIFDILTDLALVALPLPMIFSARLPTKIKAETLLLMLFPLLNVAFTCFRLPTIAANQGTQSYRTFTASVDLLVSTSSANALVVISFLQDRGFKKLRYKYQDGDDGPIDHLTSPGLELKSMDNASPLAISRPVSTNRGPCLSPLKQRPTWGSDEDLMRGDDSDGGPTEPTTSAGDAELGTSEIEGAAGGPLGLSLDSTNHLSPHRTSETSIVAARRVAFAVHEEDPAVQPRLQQSQMSLNSGIIVQTSWQVQVSEK